MKFLLKGIITLILICYVNPEGRVGCLFTDKLCVPDLESCFNDNVYGRCVPTDWNAGKENLKYDLKFEELEALKSQLVDLNALGYDWYDKYTQCIVQAQLYAIKTQQEYVGTVCDRFMKSKGRSFSERKPHLRNSWSVENQGLPSHSIVKDMEMTGDIPYDTRDADDYVDGINFAKKAAYNRPPYAGTPLFQTKYRKESVKIEKAKEEKEDVRKNDLKEEGKYENVGTEEENVGKGNVFYSDTGIIPSLVPVRRRVTGGNDSVNEKMSRRRNPYLRGFRRMERLDVKKPGPYYSINNYAFDNTYSIKGEPKVTRDTVSFVGPKHALYSKTFKSNGYEYVKGSIKPYSKEATNDPYFFLQTKKPIKSTVESQLIVKTLMELLKLPSDSFYNTSFGDKEVSFQVAEKTGLTAATLRNKIDEVEDEFSKKTGLELVVEKTFSSSSSPPSSSDSSNVDQSDYYSVVDMSYAFIEFNEPIEDTDLGQKIVKEIETHLKVPSGTFQNIQAEDNTVTFKVPNMYGLDSTIVAKKIDTQYFRDRISNVFGMKVNAIGIGDKHKLPLVTPLINNDSLFVLTLLICTATLAICGIVVIFYVINRNYISKKSSKLNEKEHSTQYQEFCRGRVMKGNTNDSGPSSVPPQRITSLSDSPSSRSSTSSWSEEPVTNMDITTGHMVLAYMEDHLTNKARLDMEWAALCAYEADPCSALVAQQKENIKKNRYINALPYDHARIVLNALSNIAGSDYINASTITDHDPRNHAYIATQGPLENTVDDFWQMIWEQGCVVIVMLTRLIENDVSLCHRYWPQEGSELYHIYEVHLVSEHIWCDDFLVRSFYLKNTKTTETRTVTQFHFLTWMEGGVPNTPKPLLEFRRKVNKSFRGRSCPIVVHCSDGVGRTGSYLLLDMVLNRISKGAKEIDIAATLEHIRDQRIGAVSTKAQFQFILQAVAEEVQAILRALPTQAPATSTLHEELNEQSEKLEEK